MSRRTAPLCRTPPWPSASSAIARFRCPTADFFSGSRSATARRRRSICGARRASACCPAPTWDEKSIPENPHKSWFSYIRVALVNDLSTIMKALERMVEILGRDGMSGRAAGVYQPRSRSAAMADALAEARRAVGRHEHCSSCAAPARLLLLASRLVALVSYDPGDASLNNADGGRVTTSGTDGRHSRRSVAADLRLRGDAHSSPPAVWGARALFGRPRPRGGARLRLAARHGSSGRGSWTVPVPVNLARRRGGTIGIAVCRGSRAGQP